MTHLADCELANEDKFIDNQILHLDEDLRIITVPGKYSVHKIDTAVAHDELQWLKFKDVEGYDTLIDDEN